MRVIAVNQVGGPGAPMTRASLAGRAWLERRIVHVDDVLAAVDEFPEAARLARSAGHRTTLAAPLLRQGERVGVIVTSRAGVRPFPAQQIALLETFADQAVIAIENARLFQELNDSNASLREALEQQTATAEVLRVIAVSPTNLQAVLQAI